MLSVTGISSCCTSVEGNSYGNAMCGDLSFSSTADVRLGEPSPEINSAATSTMSSETSLSPPIFSNGEEGDTIVTTQGQQDTILDCTPEQHSGCGAESSEVDGDLAPDVELEADAESLASSESDDGSEENIPELEYFRFSRSGLSVTFPLRCSSIHPHESRMAIHEEIEEEENKQLIDREPFIFEPQIENLVINSPSINKDNLLTIESTVKDNLINDIHVTEELHQEKENILYNSQLDGCQIVNFEELCRTQYPVSHFVGCMVGRYSGEPLNKKDKDIYHHHTLPVINDASVSQSLTETTLGCPVSHTPVDPVIKPNSSFISDPAGSGLGIPRPLNRPNEDRLSAVIQDILHRLNRQGVLADPRDVCRKGGGRSGEYYDKDDQFFDDTLALEHLGLSSTSPTRHSRKHRSSSCDLNELNNSETTVFDSTADLEPLDFNNYVDSTTFTCDNQSNNDDILLYPDILDGEDEGSISSDTTSGSADFPVLTEGEDEGMHQNLGQLCFSSMDQEKRNGTRSDFITKKHWIKRKAWRGLESKLSDDVINVLTKLEESLQGKGTKKGLYVPPIQVATLCRDAMKDVFMKLYPKVSWDIQHLIASSFSNQPIKDPLPTIKNCKSVNRQSDILEKEFIFPTDNEEYDIEILSDDGKKSCFRPIIQLPQDVPFIQHDLKTNDESSTHQTLSDIDLIGGYGFDTPPLLQNSHGVDTTEKAVTDNTTVSDKSNSTIHIYSKGALSSTELCQPLKLQDHLTQQKHIKTLTQHGIQKKSKKSLSSPINSQQSLTADDLVSLTPSPILQQLSTCLTKMTSAVTPELMKRWLSMRLIIHNQVVYSALEDRLYHFITKKSILFRTKGSFFFRALKKAVDIYLKSLASTTEKGTANHLNKSTMLRQPIQSTLVLETNKEGSDIIQLSNQLPCSQHQQTAGVDSPFAPVATELLNWAVVYNCRRHELRELGETLDEWTATFPVYAVEVLNKSIHRRRHPFGEQSNSVTIGTQPSLTVAQKKQRIWVPAKFFEDTLNSFKLHYGVTSLYERRNKKYTLPAFVLPCKGLNSPVLRTVRQARVRTHQFHPVVEQPIGTHLCIEDNGSISQDQQSQLLVKDIQPLIVCVPEEPVTMIEESSDTKKTIDTLLVLGKKDLSSNRLCQVDKSKKRTRKLDDQEIIITSNNDSMTHHKDTPVIQKKRKKQQRLPITVDGTLDLFSCNNSLCDLEQDIKKCMPQTQSISTTQSTDQGIIIEDDDKQTYFKQGNIDSGSVKDMISLESCSTDIMKSSTIQTSLGMDLTSVNTSTIIIDKKTLSVEEDVLVGRPPFNKYDESFNAIVDQTIPIEPTNKMISETVQNNETTLSQPKLLKDTISLTQPTSLNSLTTKHYNNGTHKIDSIKDNITFNEQNNLIVSPIITQSETNQNGLSCLKTLKHIQTPEIIIHGKDIQRKNKDSMNNPVVKQLDKNKTKRGKIISHHQYQSLLNTNPHMDASAEGKIKSNSYDSTVSTINLNDRTTPIITNSSHPMSHTLYPNETTNKPYYYQHTQQLPPFSYYGNNTVSPYSHMTMLPNSILPPWQSIMSSTSSCNFPNNINNVSHSRHQTLQPFFYPTQSVQVPSALQTCDASFLPSLMNHFPPSSANSTRRATVTSVPVDTTIQNVQTSYSSVQNTQNVQPGEVGAQYYSSSSLPSPEHSCG